MYVAVYADRVTRPARSTRWRGLRGRLPLTILLAACLVAAAAAVSGAGTTPPGLSFADVGRWFADPDADQVFHVNGTTRSIDAHTQIEGIEDGSEVVQGETSGYVVGPTRITEFDKSSLTQKDTTVPPAAERPVPVEAKGGPYLVFRQAGSIVRLGARAATIPAGGVVGPPVVAPDGTLWLHRPDAGLLCHLAPDADRVSCTVAVPAGRHGALTLARGAVTFLDTDADTLSPVHADSLGTPVTLDIDLPDEVQVAGADLHGRIAVLDPRTPRLVLVDADSGQAVRVTLPGGRWTAPAAGRSSVVLLDAQARRVHSYASDGRAQGTTAVRAGAGEPRLSRGQDGRVYIEGGDGRNVLVVDDRGGVGAVTGGPATAAGPVTSASGPVPPMPGTTPPSAPGTSPAVPPSSRPSAPTGPGTTQDTTAPPRAGLPEADLRPVPAGGPGMPPGLTVVARGPELVVTWGPAAPHGAPITAYHLAWEPGGGSIHPGGARSATISAPIRGVTYRITLAAKNSAGVGAPATVTIPYRTLTVRRGVSAEHLPDCLKPRCAKFHIELRGFDPNTKYQIDPYSSVHGDFNPGAALATDEKGDLTSRSRFPYSGIGDTVWVIVDGQESNHYVWPPGD